MEFRKWQRKATASVFDVNDELVFSLCWLSCSSPVDTRYDTGKNPRALWLRQKEKNTYLLKSLLRFQGIFTKQWNLISLPEDISIKISELCGWWEWLLVSWLTSGRQFGFSMYLQRPGTYHHSASNSQVLWLQVYVITPSYIVLWSQPGLTHVNLWLQQWNYTPNSLRTRN